MYGRYILKSWRRVKLLCQYDPLRAKRLWVFTYIIMDGCLRFQPATDVSYKITNTLQSHFVTFSFFVIIDIWLYVYLVTRHSNPEKYVRGYLHYGFIPRSCPKYLLFHDAVTTNPDSRLHKKRKPSFFSNNINIYSINNIICTLVDQIPFIAYKSQSEVTKKKKRYIWYPLRAKNLPVLVNVWWVCV